jgi:hypothetical protein
MLSLELCSRCSGANSKIRNFPLRPRAQRYTRKASGTTKGEQRRADLPNGPNRANATFQSSVSCGMPACAFLPLWFLGALPGRISGCSGLNSSVDWVALWGPSSLQLEGNFGPACRRVQSCRGPEPPRRKPSGRARSRNPPGSQATSRDLVGMERSGRYRIRCNGPHGSARSSNVRAD